MDTKSEEMEDLNKPEAEAPEENQVESAEDIEAVEAAEALAEESPEVAEEECAEAQAELSVEQEMLKWKEAALRSSAELENYRKRMVREKADAIRYASQSLVEELLPVLDNFEMGLMAASQDEGSMIFTGMQMVKNQMVQFLENQGVKEVKAEGEFDPNLHEALSEEESEEVEPGHILRVQRKGYLLHDRLVRAAAVVVAKSKDEKEGD
ncbi:MAG: nucleotide exchange factor GrpE [Verrucomicrobiales bacterium]